MKFKIGSWVTGNNHNIYGVTSKNSICEVLWSGEPTSRTPNGLKMKKEFEYWDDESDLALKVIYNGNDREKGHIYGVQSFNFKRISKKLAIAKML